jgi:hypothetical protein
MKALVAVNQMRLGGRESLRKRFIPKRGAGRIANAHSCGAGVSEWIEVRR